MPNGLGFYDDIDRLTMRWVGGPAEDALEAFRPLVSATTHLAMRRLGEERRRTSRNGYGEGGFNPTLTERRGKDR